MKSLRHFAGALLLLALSTSQAASGQAPAPDSTAAAPGTGTITGRVTFEGSPLPGVTVSLLQADPARPFLSNVLGVQAVTDREGKFRLAGVPAGVLTLTPAPGAYAVPREGNYGQPGKTIVVRAGEEVEGVELSLKQGRVITGQVTDSEGSPVVGQRVTLESLEGGATKLLILTGPPNDTDDRGVYRLYGVPPGRYLVSIRGSRDFSASAKNPDYYPTVYHPGVVEESEARVVEVGSGGEAVGDVNIVLKPRAELYTVAGRVVDSATQQPLPNVRYGFGKNPNSARSPATPFASRTSKGGEFLIGNLAPGQYVVFAVPDPDSNAYSDAVPFVVTAGDVKGLEVKVHRGATLTGRLLFEGMNRPSPRQPLKGLRVMASQRDATGRLNTVTANIGSDGGFILNGLRPGKAHLMARSDSPGRLSTVRVEKDGQEQTGGIDVHGDAPVSGVSLFVEYRDSTLRGVIKHQNGALHEGARFRVVLRRPGAAGRIVGVAESDPQHSFVMTEVPAGDFECVVYEITTGSSARRLPSPFTKPVSVTGGANDVVITLDVTPEP